MPYQEIDCAADGPIAYLTLNNPARINALSTTMVGKLTEAIQAIGKQPLNEQIDMGDEKALAYEACTIALNCLAEDARIGIHAFLQKTTPEWKNR